MRACGEEGSARRGASTHADKRVLIELEAECSEIDEEKLIKAVGLVKDRVNTTSELWGMCKYLFFEPTNYNEENLKKVSREGLNKIVAEVLEKSLADMNELDREVIALRHFEELSNIETAKILEIEPSAASKRYLRALKKLREIMETAKGHDDR